LAKQAKYGPQARRLLALSAIYEGGSGTEAAKIGAVTLQIVREPTCMIPRFPISPRLAAMTSRQEWRGWRAAGGSRDQSGWAEAAVRSGPRSNRRYFTPGANKSSGRYRAVVEALVHRGSHFRG
jgi:hypothetical protein